MIAQDASIWYQLFQRFIRLLFRLLTHLDVQGAERIPAQGPVIVALNHLHLVDSPLTYAITRRRITVFAADKWQRTPFGWLLTIVANAIFVARGEPDRRALSRAMAVLNRGRLLAVAPEGTRSRTGSLQEGKDGVAYMASRTGAVIVPLSAWGQEHIVSDWLHLRRPSIHVRIGEPIALPPEATHARTAELHVYTKQMMLSIARALPEQYRGVYSDEV